MEKIALSFDIEDWFCVQNMSTIFPFREWSKCELRVLESSNYILKMLRSRNIKATFFILGWIAERFPELVQNIAQDGHEIASHGYSHTPVTHLTKKEFQEDLEKSIDILTKITSRPITGFRAPSFSITKATTWALDILRHCGIKYDSSIYPVNHPDYGIPDFPMNIHDINGIIEVPLTTSSLFGLELPISGGGYFRLYPYWFFKIMLKKKIRSTHAVTYFHPWEFDSDQPKVDLPFTKKFRHYIGLNQNKLKFERFISDFNFVPIADLVSDYHILQRQSDTALTITLGQEATY